MADQTPQAYFAESATVTILKKGGTAQNITSLVTNYAESGGGRDTESVAHFGGAFITIRKPRDEFEVSFDIDINDTTFMQFMGGSVTEFGSATTGSVIKVESSGAQLPHKLKIEWFDPEVAAALGSTAGSDAGAGFKVLYYNAFGVEYNKNNDADDRLTGTIKFNAAPADESGSGQKIEIEIQDFGGDSAGSGSYVDFETELDTQFGY